MNFSYHDIKASLYVLQTLFGIFLIIASIYLFKIAAAALTPISYLAAGVVVMVVGIASTFFGIETYLLRDDPDIWR